MDIGRAECCSKLRREQVLQPWGGRPLRVFKEGKGGQHGWVE